MLPSAAIRLSCDVRHFQNNLDTQMAVCDLRLLTCSFGVSPSGGFLVTMPLKRTSLKAELQTNK